MSLPLLGAGAGSPGVGLPLLQGLLSYWHLGSLVDEVGNNTWNPFGSTHFVSLTIPGVGPANAFDFGNGGADVLNSQVGFNGPDLDLFNQDLSVSYWVRLTNIGVTSAPFGRANANNAGQYYFEANPGGDMAFYIENGVGRHVTPSGVLQVGIWYNIIGTYTVADLTPRIYVNSVISSNAPIPSVITSVPGYETRVGSNGTNYTYGEVGEIGIWNRVLTPGERTQLQTKIYPFT